ncbi:GuaB3 family IMP dehydrogenase-related protein [Corynebacterium sp. 320]|uniref:GuaB3 family IMP dehydrogenase-related protein n=1 Tax=Corynebacterium zhongnanshanii TaxID=2768834 RepID=A0ABQ6VER0_9CORY|nr:MULTISPECIES: GuaB3 family IMP dehydrogenase-related protein [Corynebacterium]KAB1504236.1 GuaB3 family IMP dehydrogenase-related protein [Corynebacterium sp. 320]KAB1552664.1 GuaB3 family IMP dehydrogenase-related protein [Corynebacterium sp. 321]KAB1554118.1 GuaB3 family IMP dehydrogenase-related protein [Corynebacterium sp. 319]KAB3522907.1 GuaB3 family IMP dehydrogenase-related protein [Corynebacterium zhongnanshanii]KAB3528372.1 GuaB3 family IMP dehydrogenase-related protein [Corynebac
MQDFVDIGRGRTARRVYGLNQVDIVPSRRTRSSHDVDMSWKIDAYQFDIPVMAHPSDAVVSPQFAIEFGKMGGLPVINAEGLWGRAENLEAALQEIVEASLQEIAEASLQDEYVNDANLSNRVLQKYHAMPLNRELLAERLQTVRDSGVRFGVRVSPQNARELAPFVIASGVDLLVIQGTLVSAEHVHRDGEPLNLKEFIGSLDVPVIAGGVVDYTTALHLMRTGAAGVIVGSGPTTNNDVLGIDVPMATAIADAAYARRDYLDETGGRYVHVIADSALSTSGDIAKALACGADAVSLGAPLAAADCAGTPNVFWPSTAAHPSAPRGVIESVGVQEPVSLERLLFGPTSSPFGDEDLVGAVRRSMAKCGYTDVKSFQKVGLVVR